MGAAYEDILERCGQPLWYDEAGAPRYAPFHPDLCNNPYAKQAALLRIACQQCGMEFRVAYTVGPWEGDRFVRALQAGTWHAGDPPRHGHYLKGAYDWNNDCSAGSTMNCEDLEVIEFWVRDHLHGWKRVSELEGPREKQREGRDA